MIVYCVHWSTMTKRAGRLMLTKKLLQKICLTMSKGRILVSSVSVTIMATAKTPFTLTAWAPVNLLMFQELILYYHHTVLFIHCSGDCCDLYRLSVVANICHLLGLSAAWLPKALTARVKVGYHVTLT
jgi:hypothetical protein